MARQFYRSFSNISSAENTFTYIIGFKTLGGACPLLPLFAACPFTLVPTMDNNPVTAK
jgi:hypothetical protein